MDSDELIIAKLRNNLDGILSRHLRLKLIEIYDKTYSNSDDLSTGVYINKLEKIKVFTDYIRLNLERDKKFLVKEYDTFITCKVF